MKYSKPPASYEAQIQILKDRGLIIKDEDFARHCLEHHNYYRLSAYRFPLAVSGSPDRFLPDTTFDDLWNLYHFDRTLRQLVSEAVKRVEISVRSRWVYVLSHRYGPLAYEDPKVFRDLKRHNAALDLLDNELKKSHEVFVKHYRERYQMKRPPIWAMSEVLTFGSLSRFYENVKRTSDKKEISRTYDLSPELLKSLLEHCVYIRNLCAHHSRLWNRQFTISVELPNRSPVSVVESIHPSEDRRIYNTLVLLLHMLKIIEPHARWPVRLVDLLNTISPRFHPHMGFPSDWMDRPLWKPLSS